MTEPKVGDYVRYKLKPSGIEGTCLLTEEGESESRGTPMFLGQQVPGSRHEVGAVNLYPEDIVEVLSAKHAVGPVECWSCDHSWVAVRPASEKVFECPSCGEMMGARSTSEAGED